MILLLGKREYIRKYCNDNGIDIRDMFVCPHMDMHYTDYYKCIDLAKCIKCKYINTQNNEMLDIILKSDLEISNIITIVEVDGEIKIRDISKEKAIQLKYEYEIELR